MRPSAEFVDLYAKYLLVDSVENQFVPFYEGFHAVAGGPALKVRTLSLSLEPIGFS